MHKEERKTSRYCYVEKGKTAIEVHFSGRQDNVQRKQELGPTLTI